MEIRIPYHKIRSSQSITPVIQRVLAERFGEAHAIHRYDVVKMEDDDGLKVRVITLKPKTYHVL